MRGGRGRGREGRGRARERGLGEGDEGMGWGRGGMVQHVIYFDFCSACVRREEERGSFVVFVRGGRGRRGEDRGGGRGDR